MNIFRSTHNRISFLIISLCCILCTSVNAQEHKDLRKQLMDYANNKMTHVGVSVIIDGKDTLTLNNEINYPMMSVYKLHQAIAVADRLSSKNIPLDTLIYVSRNDLRKDTYSPLRDDYPEGNRMFSVKDLLHYTLLLSDNNACDILFDKIIGIKDTEKFIHDNGIKDCFIKATEKEMQDNKHLCYKNISSPQAATELLELLLRGKLLNGEYKQFVISTLLECQTGQNRLPSFIHNDDVKIGHKTGTGGVNDRNELIAVNDTGFVLLPNNHSYTIAVFVKDSRMTLEETEKIISDISKMVYLHISRVSKS